MNNNDKSDPTPEERAEADRAIREFMAAQAAVPESERTQITSDKFDGPIGEPADASTDESQAPSDSDRQ